MGHKGKSPSLNVSQRSQGTEKGLVSSLAEDEVGTPNLVVETGLEGNIVASQGLEQLVQLDIEGEPVLSLVVDLQEELAEVQAINEQVVEFDRESEPGLLSVEAVSRRSSKEVDNLEDSQEEIGRAHV